jgi:hypothetical protein
MASAFRGCDQSANQKHDAVYQSALQSYSEVLAPGTTRKNVEDYLRAKGVSFFQEGGAVSTDDGAFADLAKIGKEKHPWYCSEHAVYLAFHFTAVQPPGHSRAPETDALKSITIYHQLEDCL